MVLISDSLAIIGVSFLIGGLYRLVRLLGFFDSAIYGTKKLWEILRNRDYGKSGSGIGTFQAYRERHSYYRPYVGLVVLGMGLMFLSLVVALLS